MHEDKYIKQKHFGWAVSQFKDVFGARVGDPHPRQTTQSATLGVDGFASHYHFLLKSPARFLLFEKLWGEMCKQGEI